VCATHQDLEDLIKQQRFREDLYYRLAEIVVNIPALRDRQGDAVLLGQAFLKRFGQDQRRSLSFSEDAMTAIEQHNWPGNVRQLLNAIKRASIMADGNRVSAQDLGLTAAARSADADAAADAPSLDLRQAREAAERQVVLAALARTAGNMARTADLLGVSRPTLYDLMSRLGIRQQVES
jgi:two-component system, NtrC family, response regulator